MGNVLLLAQRLQIPQNAAHFYMLPQVNGMLSVTVTHGAGYANGAERVHFDRQPNYNKQ